MALLVSPLYFWGWASFFSSSFLMALLVSSSSASPCGITGYPPSTGCENPSCACSPNKVCYSDDSNIPQSYMDTRLFFSCSFPTPSCPSGHVEFCWGWVHSPKMRVTEPSCQAALQCFHTFRERSASVSPSNNVYKVVRLDRSSDRKRRMAHLLPRVRLECIEWV